nr:DUF1289 domain-containing protein [Pseudoalteromonas sp. MMG024]
MADQKPIIEQIEIFEIPSPCKGVCQANNRGYCLGCFRSREERFHWNQLTNAQKKHVIKLCAQREKRIRQKMAQQQISPELDTEQTKLDF